MLSKKLENLRDERDWSKARVARELKIPPTTYNGYENGKHMPSVYTLINIAKLYNVSLDYLMDLSINSKYQFPNEIKTTGDAQLFIKNLILLTKNKNSKEVIEFAQNLLYISRIIK